MGKALFLAAVLVACAADSPPLVSPSAHEFFDRSVYPVLLQQCSGNTSGCHGGGGGISPVPTIGDSPDATYTMLTASALVDDFGDNAPLLTAHQPPLFPAISDT